MRQKSRCDGGQGFLEVPFIKYTICRELSSLALDSRRREWYLDLQTNRKFREAVSLAKYMTRQRKTLLGYLSRHPDEALSAQAIAAALELAGVSLSAVYRNLAELEAEGQIRRASREGSREVYYQYTGSEACKDSLHLKCKKCGRTFHMDANGAEQLLGVVEKAEGFAVDKGDTVLYGVCELCQD